MSQPIHFKSSFKSIAEVEADSQIRTGDPLITNQISVPTITLDAPQTSDSVVVHDPESAACAADSLQVSFKSSPTSTEISDMFNSRPTWHRGDCDDVSRLARALRLGRATLTHINYREYPTSGRGVRRSVLATARQADGTECHAILKYWAYLWLKLDQKASDAEFERRCIVGRADVFSERRKTIVECGNCEPRKALRAMEHKYRLVLFPFASEGNDHPGAYIFEATPAYQDERDEQWSLILEATEKYCNPS